MNQAVEQFIKKMKEDPGFTAELQRMSNKEDVIALAKKQGIELVVEDIDAVNESIRTEYINRIDRSTPAGQFLAKLMEDQAFAEKVVEKSELEEVITLAEGYGISVTKDEIELVNRIITGTGKQGGELSEEDLENVAGGTLFTSIGEITIVTAITVVSVIVVTAIVNPDIAHKPGL